VKNIKKRKHICGGSKNRFFNQGFNAFQGYFEYSLWMIVWPLKIVEDIFLGILSILKERFREMLHLYYYFYRYQICIALKA
jgi:hypothetical protein